MWLVEAMGVDAFRAAIEQRMGQSLRREVRGGHCWRGMHHDSYRCGCRLQVPWHEVCVTQHSALLPGPHSTLQLAHRCMWHMTTPGSGETCWESTRRWAAL